MNAERVIKHFNRVNGTALRYGNEGTLAIVKRFEGKYSEEQLIEVIDNNPSENISEIINANFLAMYFSQKQKTQEAEEKMAELEAQLQKKKEMDLEQEQSNMSLGLVERALARVMIDEYSPMLAESVFQNAKDFIEKEYGKIEKKITYTLPELDGNLDEVTHEEFETVLGFVMANEPVMLIGPAGTGKNVICKQIAKIMNLDFYFSNAVTQEYKLTGFIDAHGKYQETEFYKAFKNGGIFMLDEIDASIPEVLVILNAAIANRYFDFPNGKIDAHPDFRVIAAGNTYGTGASCQYVGRNQLDSASLDRFAQVEIEYSPRIENSLTKDQELLNFIRKFRRECNNNGNNHIVSYRTITRLDKMANVLPIEKCLRTCLLKNMEADSLNMIVKVFKADTRWEEALRKIANAI